MSNILKKILNGIWTSNPVLILLLGFCPTLAVSTTLNNAIGMAFAATFVLVSSNIVISTIRNFVPNKMRIPVFIIVIATFVILVDLVMYGYFPKLHKSLGVFIPLIVVNCIVFGRAEAYASKNKVFDSFLDGLGMGLGFLLIISVLAAIREIIGNGTLWGIKLFGDSYTPAIVAILPPGAFLTVGLMIGGMNFINIKNNEKARIKQKLEKEKVKI